MPKKSKSKSGLFEILKVKNAKSKFDSTEVDIRIPKFQNFGLGLAELERQADEYEKKLEAEMTPKERAKEEAEADAAIQDLTKAMRATAEEAKKEFEKTSKDDPKKKSMDAIFKMMEEAVGMMESEPEDEAPEDEEAAPEKVSKPEDFELLTVLPSDGTKWDAKAEAKIDEFIKTWPEVRPQVLKQAHACYKKLYPELKEIFGDMATFKFTMPKPTKPEVIEDIFSINVIYLRDDGAVGISGSCTWDEEHGFGAVIRNGKVVTFGHASDGFC